MNNSYIIRILNESALQAKHSFDMEELRFVEANNRTYEVGEFNEFKRDLLEAGLFFMRSTRNCHALSPARGPAQLHLACRPAPRFTPLTRQQAAMPGKAP
jgi:hypothetical protein